MLAACGSSNEGSASEEKVYLEDSQIQQLFTDPEQFKGKYAKMSGVLLANPETDSDGSTALQIFYDTQNYDQIKVRPLDINTKGEFPTKV